MSLLRKIYQDKGPVFLFESVEGGERWGRYSFLGVSARTHVRGFSEFVEVREDGTVKQILHSGDPLSVLRTLMNRYRPAHVPGLPRFWGGLVGYLTYEMVSFFESIPNLLPASKPLAHFIVPDKLLIFDNIRHTLVGVVISFLDKEKDADSAFQSANESVQALLKDMERQRSLKNSDSFGSSFDLKAPWEDEVFRDLVKQVKTYIRAGDVIQTVISKPFICSPSPDLWTLYRAQRYINPSPYLFFLHLDGMALVGPPETMVRLENRVATLRPIAGTRPKEKASRKTGRSPTSCFRMKKNAPNISCWWIWGGTIWAGGGNRLGSGDGPDDRGALFTCHAPGFQHLLRS